MTSQPASRLPRLMLAGVSAFLMLVVDLPVRAAEPAWWHGELRLASGFDLSKGDYGASVDTELLYVPFSVSWLMDDFPLTAYPWDQLEFRVTVPYLHIEGPDDFFSGMNSVGSRTDSGLGDVLVRASYIWLPLTSSRLPVIEVKGQLKIPTAKRSRNLGTGSTDLQLAFELSKSFGSVTPFVAAGHRFIGNSRSLGLRDFFFTSLGASLRVHSRVSLGLDYAWAQAAASSRRDSHELVSFANLRLPGGLSLGPYLSFGLGGYTPDYGGGLSILYRLPLRGESALTP